MARVKYVFLGIFFSLVIFFLFGIISSLIPNEYFVRMIEPKVVDYVFLVLTSILLGVYLSLSIFEKDRGNKCDYMVGGGAVLGVFSFACPVCNVLLVSIFGASAILTYFEPYRPILGIISIALIGLALWYKILK
jgi:hypothetical protein